MFRERGHMSIYVDTDTYIYIYTYIYKVILFFIYIYMHVYRQRDFNTNTYANIYIYMQRPCAHGVILLSIYVYNLKDKCIPQMIIHIYIYINI